METGGLGRTIQRRTCFSNLNRFGLKLIDQTTTLPMFNRMIRIIFDRLPSIHRHLFQTDTLGAAKLAHQRETRRDLVSPNIQTNGTIWSY
jgi:hypothetical protein